MKGSILKEVGIVIGENTIIPFWNENVFKQAANHMVAVNENHPGAKYMCLHHANFMVYFAIMEGAKRQGIDLDLSLAELWALIDYQDFFNALSSYQRQEGKGPELPIFN